MQISKCISDIKGDTNSEVSMTARVSAQIEFNPLMVNPIDSFTGMRGDRDSDKGTFTEHSLKSEVTPDKSLGTPQIKWRTTATVATTKPGRFHSLAASMCSTCVG